MSQDREALEAALDALKRHDFWCVRSGSMGKDERIHIRAIKKIEAALAAREEPTDEKRAIEHYRRQRDENAGVAEGLAERVHRELGDYAAYLAAMEELTTEDYELPTRPSRSPQQ